MRNISEKKIPRGRVEIEGMVEGSRPTTELTLIDPRDTELKRVEYEGFHGLRGEVVYQIHQGRILFSAIRSSRDATSTVNAAESVILAICRAEGINWKDPSFPNTYRFFDMSTPIGYPARADSPLERMLLQLVGLGEVQIDELKIRSDGENIFVESWIPVDLHGSPIGSQES